MSQKFPDLWLREQAVAADEAARDSYEAHVQRGRDLTDLANALMPFFEHPNTPEEDKDRVQAALIRLLGTKP